MSGRLSLRCGPGDLPLALVGVEHRFEDFSEDLTVWAISFGSGGGDQARS